MEFNGNLRNPMEIHAIQWKFKKSNGNSWKFLEIHKHPVEIHRIRWKSTESAGNPWNSMEIHGIQWKSMETYGNPWNPMEIHRIRWKSMEFYGNLRNPVEFRIQTNRNSNRSLVEILGILWEPKEIQWIFMEVQKSENN